MAYQETNTSFNKTLSIDLGGEKEKRKENSTLKKWTFNKPFMQRLRYIDNSTFMIINTAWWVPRIIRLPCDNIMTPRTMACLEFICIGTQSGVKPFFSLVQFVTTPNLLPAPASPNLLTLFSCAIWWISSEWIFRIKTKQNKTNSSIYLSVDQFHFWTHLRELDDTSKAFIFFIFPNQFAYPFYIFWLLKIT